MNIIIKRTWNQNRMVSEQLKQELQKRGVEVAEIGGVNE